jgi:hypothetical protein
MQRLTKEQAAIIGAFTGFTAGPFGDIQEYAEKLLGRPIFTHEFAQKELVAELKEAARPDFFAICHNP